jgi:hypothetical protein
VRRLADKPRQLVREHPGAAASLGVAAAIGIYLVAARRRDEPPIARLRRRGRAYRAFLADPERLLRRHPSLGRQLLGAALAAAVTTVVRQIAAGAIDRAARRRRSAPIPIS